MSPDADGVTLTRTTTSTGAPEYTVECTRGASPTTLVPGSLADLEVVRPRRSRCGGRRRARRRARADRRTRAHPRAVRPSARDVPGGRPADRRRLHHRAHDAPRRDGGELAARERRGRRDDDIADRRVLARRRGARPRCRSCHHLHGGLGVDITYPLHRYYSQAKDLARFVGGAALRLERIGAHAHRTDRRAARRCRANCATTSRSLVTRGRGARDARRPGTATTYRDVVQRMGRDGWLGVGWPIEFGGRGFGQLEQTIFVNEAARRDIPLPYVTLQTVGPVLQRYGTQEQKDFFLPRILAGDLHFAIGYTEPEAGTDLANLRTTAVRDGDHVRRQRPEGVHDRRPRRRLRLARRAAPTRTRRSTRASRSSSSTRPIRVSRGRRRSPPTARTTSTRPTTRTCACRCRCASARRTQGWQLITTQLNHERVMLGPAGRLAGLYDRVHDWARARPDGSLRSSPDVRRALAEMRADHAASTNCSTGRSRRER